MSSKHLGPAASMQLPLDRCVDIFRRRLPLLDRLPLDSFDKRELLTLVPPAHAAFEEHTRGHFPFCG